MANDSDVETARLLISCPDQPGIVAAVSQFLFAAGANVVHSDQHTSEPVGGMFSMRLAFDLPDFDEQRSQLERNFAAIGERFNMQWRFANARAPKRIAIFVSRQDHCLLELLWRRQAGDLFCDIVMVISNHPDVRETVEARGIPFHHIPVAASTKAQSEAKQLALLGEGAVDLVVLARYMQVLSPAFTAAYPNRIVNIHHGLLPAFVGADPYRRAYERGVKLIGATAHYVIADLDAGPIIEQDVQRIDHRHGIDELHRKGRYLERVVLARAVEWHVEDRVIVDGGCTVVFGT